MQVWMMEVGGAGVDNGGMEVGGADEAHITLLKDGLQRMFKELECKLANQSSLYEEPIRKMVSRYDAMHTDSAIISGLSTFGTYSGAAVSVSHHRLNLRTSKQIGVQPTAVARRKMAVGGRRK